MLSKVLGNGRTNNRRKGNQYRDARDWVRAASAYAQHLDVNGDDQPIWVQLGHARKEQGLLAEAAEAYQTAADLDDGDADAAMHLADVLRRLGHGDAALAAYRRASDISPNIENLHQIRLLSRDARATTAIGLGAGTTFFAVQDLFGYLKVHSTMSGIQRVQAGIAMHAIRDAAIDVRFIVGDVGPGTPILPAGEFWMIDNAHMRRVIDYASGKIVDHETLRALLLACEETAERVRPLHGSTIILLGAFWGLGDSVRKMVRSKRDGVRIGAYIYDIIPVSHPEFCDDSLVTDFAMAICEICATADFILTISDATRFALADFIAFNGGQPIPMTTVPLAHHLTHETDHAVTWPAQLKAMQGKRYAAYISTIEGRKNHLYVVNAWRRLIAEGVDVPDLVFVGRHGWKIDALTDVLKATDNLDGRLHIAHNLTDGELNAIYAGCDFSIFTSFVEGWGLPVGESLFHGRPCVASNSSSIPEVGGDLVDYVDPFNLTEGIEVFRRMIVDRSYLRGRVAAIRDTFVARTWGDVSIDFLEQVKKYQGLPITPFDLVLPEGNHFSFQFHAGDRVDTRRYSKRLNRLMVESSFFYGSEDHGIWMHGASPTISIATDKARGMSVLVYIGLSIAPGAEDVRLTITDLVSGTETASITLRDLGRRGGAVRLPTRIGEDGAFELRFDIVGSYAPVSADSRDFVIGLRSIGYAAADNLVARQELLEAMTMQDLSG